MGLLSVAPHLFSTRTIISPAISPSTKPLCGKKYRPSSSHSLISLPSAPRFRPLCSSTDWPVVKFEEVVEQDWSFLETDEINSESEKSRKAEKIISAAELGEGSRVLVSLGTEDLVDRLVETSKCSLLLVVHYSLLSLALIKEKYDAVRCWQGELVEVPKDWALFDAVFIPHLPALGVSLDRIFEVLAERCLPGSRVVVSHTQGRAIIEQQRQQHPDLVTSDLPDRNSLQKAASDNSFQIIEFIDEPTFFLAVLKFREEEKSD
ncbi:hypothetical protein H6P81_004352 [Aristolochia fimbriata]|uniref:Uncharacterized protein n=1 Tax=Aristolochia fimbriata TaxID=158543 RepID=A0AAV7FGS0_ARIFI|nr:hypothetical protein H6P81_004352 [Aristolochia fimbriata]